MKLYNKKIAIILALILSINVLPLNVMADVLDVDLNNIQDINNVDVANYGVEFETTDNVVSNSGILFDNKLTYVDASIDISKYEDYIINYNILGEDVKKALKKTIQSIGCI